MKYRDKYEAIAVPLLPIASIDVPEHHRPVHELVVKDLMVSMFHEGILQPIGVRVHPVEPDRFILVFGRQRLTAMQRLGDEAIPSLVLDLDAEEAQLAKDSENVNRVNVGDKYAYRFRERFARTWARRQGYDLGAENSTESEGTALD